MLVQSQGLFQLPVRQTFFKNIDHQTVIEAPATNLHSVPDRVLQRIRSESGINHLNSGLAHNVQGIVHPHANLAHSTYLANNHQL